MKRGILMFRLYELRQHFFELNVTTSTGRLEHLIYGFLAGCCNQVGQIILNQIFKKQLTNLNFQFTEINKIEASVKPNLLKDNYWIKIFQILQEKTKKIIKQSVLIYQGSKDGLNNQLYWNKVNSKSNLLMVFQSKSDYIFGAYSLCRWEQNPTGYIEDNTLQSFIFSQTHDEVYPLKSDERQKAIYCNSGRHDLRIDSNFTDGYYKLGHQFQFNQYKNLSENPYYLDRISQKQKNARFMNYNLFELTCLSQNISRE
ncbi:unnamed protein product [Paramecium octaurelia]|uniref:TLDc domain-containing protein n=1 Tax=Paramecium octaurelia TaxID=43137 RepID=A0A8S1TF81_PAROT|nr:unnamed protein product [Paramecium octaurelia]